MRDNNIILAEIKEGPAKGKRIRIDAAGSKRDDYSDPHCSVFFVYAGAGYYYSFNGTRANDSKLMYFWVERSKARFYGISLYKDLLRKKKLRHIISTFKKKFHAKSK